MIIRLAAVSAMALFVCSTSDAAIPTELQDFISAGMVLFRDLDTRSNPLGADFS